MLTLGTFLEISGDKLEFQKHFFLSYRISFKRDSGPDRSVKPSTLGTRGFFFSRAACYNVGHRPTDLPPKPETAYEKPAI